MTHPYGERLPGPNVMDADEGTVRDAVDEAKSNADDSAGAGGDAADRHNHPGHEGGSYQ